MSGHNEFYHYLVDFTNSYISSFSYKYIHIFTAVKNLTRWLIYHVNTLVYN
jgi:hypothetical protein